MAKPTLYWAIKRETYGSRYTCMRVTSETDRAVFGSEGGMPTHCRQGSVLAKHETEEAARACLAAVEAAKASWQPMISDARRVLTFAEDSCRRAMTEAARGHPQPALTS